MDNNYELLISKINEFTRKFYLNKLLRGLIYTLAILFACYLFLFLLIYYLQPDPLLKTILFFSYLLLLCGFTAIGIIKPALAYFRLSKTLSLEESAVLIGSQLQLVSDKLLNTLQLKALADLSPQQNQLILAGIDQKITELTPVPFTRAINLNDNKKYISYFMVPLVLILLIAVTAPAILKEGTSSLVAYDRKILPPAPFKFVLLQNHMTVTQGDDLRIDLQLDGDQIPQEVYLKEGLNTFKLEKETNTRFHYTFKNLQQNKTIRFFAGGFESGSYNLTVKPRSAVLNMAASLIYPAYLQKKNETISNAGDLIVPEGTLVTWKIQTENTSSLTFSLGGESKILPLQNNEATFKAALRKSQPYKISPHNSFTTHQDSIVHQIEVIADLPPSISVNEVPDSLSSKALYFTGTISDDHGFKSLNFIYALKEGAQIKKKVSVSLPVKTAQQENGFFYYWDLKSLITTPGQSLEYYFEVTDNDAVNGYKKTRSATKVYAPASAEQVARQLNKEGANLKQKMESAIKLAAQVEKESKKLGETLLDKKALSFEDKKEISQLLEKQKKLDAAVKEIQQEKEKNSYKINEDQSLKEELAEKQKKIDELFNQVLDPKTKELLEKLQRLMDQNSKDQLQNDLSKMSMDHKSLKNELDRILELYKQLEFEQNLQDKINRLNVLAKAQRELSKQAKGKNPEVNDLKKQQAAQQEQFENLKKEMNELAGKNQELERPNNFQVPEKQTQQIQKQQQQSMEKLDKKQLQSAAETQQQTAESMEQLANQMAEAQEESAEAENKVNKEELRRLLQNLLKTSFDQEKVMQSLRKMDVSDPAYTRNAQQQRGLKDNIKTIADSLASLSKRVPQLESPVRTELDQITFNLDKSIENLAERRTMEALKNQQFTMASINNLALMLNEALDQMEKNKKNSKSGKGKGKQSMQQLQKMQEQLNKNMEQAKQKLQQQGNQGTVPKGKMSEEFAKMAQQQQLIREALQQLNAQENKDGKGKMGNLNQLIQEMKATESDLINKRLEEATIKRQQQVLNKLLEAEKASAEQGEKQERESKTGKDTPPSYQKLLQQYKDKQLTEKEQLNKLPPALNYYYKNKISDYFKLLNSPR